MSNTGLTVPPYEVDAFFKAFHRLGADRLVSATGAGLGLSIVQSVAEAHGGTVNASPRQDGGLVVTSCCLSIRGDPVRVEGETPASGRRHGRGGHR
ncbi:MAG: hypothetical protein QOH50_698 [Kribbellaceae bacterium]|jgi:signal transduction histidine kinase|nr:hypothetical protein [Kribbellaceae bacterium]